MYCVLLWRLSLLQLVSVELSRRRLGLVATVHHVADAQITDLGAWMLSVSIRHVLGMKSIMTLDVVPTSAVCMMKDAVRAWSSRIACLLNLVLSWQEHKDKAH
jgi:hypothetical protein